MKEIHSVTQWKRALLEFLRRGNPFGEATLLEEYPGRVRDYPLRAGAVCVGIHSVELRSGGMGGYYGEQQDGAAALYGGNAAITARFDLFSPWDAPGAGCHLLYETLCDLLLSGDCPWRFSGIRCGEIGFDKSAAAHHLQATATLQAVLTRADAAITVQDYVVLRRD